MANFDLNQWLDAYVSRMRSVFGERVRFIGIQGSCARGEAGETSDIDVVLILDRLDYADVTLYDASVADLPERERLCGFLSGEGELRKWDASDLFQLYHDTRPVYAVGEGIAWMEEAITREDIRRAIHLGACNLYHPCIHNALHRKKDSTVAGLYKAAVFILQAKHFYETGEYVRRRAELVEKLTGDDRKILQYAMGMEGSLDEKSEFLLRWSGGLIANYKE